MKHFAYIISAIFLFSVILFCGCSSDSDQVYIESPVSGKIAVVPQITMNDELSHTAPASRAPEDETLIYTFEAWSQEATPRCMLRQSVSGTAAQAVFDIALIPGSYDFLFWADYGQGYYNTENLREVSIVDLAYVPAEKRDAFAGVINNVAWNGETVDGIILKRPLAKIIIRNTDNFDQPQSVEVQYTGVMTSYDVMTAQTSVPQNMTIAFPNTTVGEPLIGEDFLFAPSEDQTTAISISVGGVTKNLDDLELKAHYRTQIISNF